MDRRQRWLALAAGGTVVLLAAIDAYVVVSILVELAQDLDVPLDALEQLTPVVTGYLLGYIAAIPLLGQLSDWYGRKLVIQSCLAGFVLGSIITATAAALPVVVAGRVVQGIAGGALLPVTMALAADLWHARRRTVALGAIGAAQELGAVVGPLYGVGVAALYGSWRGIFWINVPIAVAAAIAVHYAIPNVRAPQRTPVDWLGGGLLAGALGLLTVGLYNPEPGRGPLPPWGVPLVTIGAAVLVGFVASQAWSRRTRLFDRSGVHLRGYAGALAVSFAAGVALLVTLVNVELFTQGLLGETAADGTLLLARFLVALPVGAVAGGMLARWLPHWSLVAIGLLLAAGSYWLISRWTLDVRATGYGPLPRMDTDLAVAGFALGLIIAPASAIALRSVPGDRHGVGSAGVVASRTMGMLIGVAVLSAWGFYRYEQLVADLQVPLPFGISAAEFNARIDAYEQAISAALLVEFREIFVGAAAVCLTGALVAVVALRTPGRRAGTIGADVMLESARNPG